MVSPAPPGTPGAPPRPPVDPAGVSGALPAGVVPIMSGPLRAPGSRGVFVAVVACFAGSVLIIGILAAIAIPSFIRYKRRAESTEATASLSRIAIAAQSQWDAARAELGPGSAAFPDATGWTPDVPPCETGSPLYAGNEEAWTTHPTWRALQFVMATSHRYRYRFTSTGVGAAATFIAEAEGDLNSNGVRAHFVRRGRIVDGRVVVGPVESTNPLD